jgi:hypothetical protein
MSTITLVVKGVKLTVDRPNRRRECGKGLVKRVRTFLEQLGTTDEAGQATRGSFGCQDVVPKRRGLEAGRTRRGRNTSAQSSWDNACGTQTLLGHGQIVQPVALGHAGATRRHGAAFGANLRSPLRAWRPPRALCENRSSPSP